jgi:hypothetical protein
MSGRRVRRRVAAVAETVMAFAATATRSVASRKILILAALAALLPAVAVPTLLYRADKASVAANSTLKCYDSIGNYEPCAARASASPSRLDVRTAAADQPPSWITTALYQEANWPANAVDQPANWTTGAPAAPHASAPRKRRALAGCRRRLIPCFFSALRKGVTHLASAAANLAQARPAREHL